MDISHLGAGSVYIRASDQLMSAFSALINVIMSKCDGSAKSPEFLFSGKVQEHRYIQYMTEDGGDSTIRGCRDRVDSARIQRES